MMAMNKRQLIDAICAEEERVFGAEGCDDPRKVRWLEEHYAIPEDENGFWRMIVAYEYDKLPPLFTMDPKVTGALENTFIVVTFLEDFLRRYQSNSDVCPRRK